MKKLYLVTGASGHVGTILVRRLLEQNELVRVLTFEQSVDRRPSNVEVCHGDITDAQSLPPFFDRTGYDALCLIHCAARITIASRPDPRVWDTNVNGTRNVLEHALRAGVDRVIYLSSVHAIPEKPNAERITEVTAFSPKLVRGQYAKSKAAAAQLALDYAKKGLKLSIVHPSGIIGPGDLLLRNHMIRTIQAMANGKLFLSVDGGYDFVDSRDVVNGLLYCETHGRAGECYILNGHYITIQELLNKIRAISGRRASALHLPYGLVRLVAPLVEGVSLLGKKPPVFTPYSIDTLQTNALFSHEKAQKEFGYAPRSIDESIRASL